MIITVLKGKYVLMGLVFVSFFSCVPNKKLVYLQKDDLKEKSLPLDTIVRSYGMEPFKYLLQPEDLLTIEVSSLTDEEFNFFSSSRSSGGNNQNLTLGNAVLFGEIIDHEGHVEFPVIGKVEVAGLSTFEVEDKLQSIAEKYLESPTVKVRLMNFRFTVLGEVNGEQTVNSFNQRVSIMEAIGLAGGLTDMADRSKVKLIRQYGDTTQVQYIDLLEEGLVNSPYYYVHQSDVIIVPPLKQRPIRKYLGQNVSLILSSLSTLFLVINLLNR